MLRYLFNLRRRKQLGYGAKPRVRKQEPWKPRSSRVPWYRDEGNLLAAIVVALAFVMVALAYAMVGSDLFKNAF